MEGSVVRGSHLAFWCGSVSFTKRRLPSRTGSVYNWVWSSWHEHLQVWGQFSVINGGLNTLGSCSWVREGGNGKWRSPDWCSIFFSVVDAVLVCTATATLKRNVHVTAKLSIYPSVYVTSLTYGHKLWEVTERIRLQKQVLESALPKWWSASSLTCQYTLCNGHIAHCHAVITHMQPFIPGITAQELAAVFS